MQHKQQLRAWWRQTRRKAESGKTPEDVEFGSSEEAESVTQPRAVLRGPKAQENAPGVAFASGQAPVGLGDADSEVGEKT